MTKFLLLDEMHVQILVRPDTPYAVSARVGALDSDRRLSHALETTVRGQLRDVLTQEEEQYFDVKVTM